MTVGGWLRLLWHLKKQQAGRWGGGGAAGGSEVTAGGGGQLTEGYPQLSPRPQPSAMGCFEVTDDSEGVKKEGVKKQVAGCLQVSSLSLACCPKVTD